MKKIEKYIIFEDNELIVINKPAGLLSIATDKEKNHTAYSMLTDYVKKQNKKNRIFVVHRLDRDTSGILMVAKNEDIKRALQDNWSEIVTYRGYYAIVEGTLSKKSGRIKSYFKETKTRIVYSTNDKKGKLAITDYKVIKESSGYCLLEISLKTGRKNQIRVHMNDIGHSIVGDKKYKSQTNPIGRLGLHAYKLEFNHPVSGNNMCFTTPLPETFKSLFPF